MTEFKGTLISGTILRRIDSEARIGIEGVLGVKLFPELRVKVGEKRIQGDTLIKEFGYGNGTLNRSILMNMWGWGNRFKSLSGEILFRIHSLSGGGISSSMFLINCVECFSAPNPRLYPYQRHRNDES